MDHLTPWTTPWLAAKCDFFRKELASQGVATPDELAAYWPGGDENAEATDGDHPGGWIFCYANYVRFLGRTEHDTTATDAEDVKTAALAALRAEPYVVTLVDPLPDGAPHRLAIHPKGYDALVHMQRRDGELLRLAIAAQRYRHAEAYDYRETAALIDAEIVYQHRVLAWILATPGARLPFDPYAVARPVPPDWTLDLSSFDFVAITEAHQHVNGRRLALIVSHLATLGAGGRRSAGFETVAASAAKTLGVPASTLLRDHTLESWLAQLVFSTPEPAAPAGGF